MGTLNGRENSGNIEQSLFSDGNGKNYAYY